MDVLHSCLCPEFRRFGAYAGGRDFHHARCICVEKQESRFPPCSCRKRLGHHWAPNTLFGCNRRASHASSREFLSSECKRRESYSRNVLRNSPRSPGI